MKNFSNLQIHYPYVHALGVGHIFYSNLCLACGCLATAVEQYLGTKSVSILYFSRLGRRRHFSIRIHYFEYMPLHAELIKLRLNKVINIEIDNE